MDVEENSRKSNPFPILGKSPRLHLEQVGQSSPFNLAEVTCFLPTLADPLKKLLLLQRLLLLKKNLFLGETEIR